MYKRQAVYLYYQMGLDSEPSPYLAGNAKDIGANFDNATQIQGFQFGKNVITGIMRLRMIIYIPMTHNSL